MQWNISFECNFIWSEKHLRILIFYYKLIDKTEWNGHISQRTWNIIQIERIKTDSFTFVLFTTTATAAAVIVFQLREWCVFICLFFSFTRCVYVYCSLLVELLLRLLVSVLLLLLSLLLLFRFVSQYFSHLKLPGQYACSTQIYCHLSWTDFVHCNF